MRKNVRVLTRWLVAKKRKSDHFTNWAHSAQAQLIGQERKSTKNCTDLLSTVFFTALQCSCSLNGCARWTVRALIWCGACHKQLQNLNCLASCFYVVTIGFRWELYFRVIENFWALAQNTPKTGENTPWKLVTTSLHLGIYFTGNFYGHQGGDRTWFQQQFISQDCS